MVWIEHIVLALPPSEFQTFRTTFTSFSQPDFFTDFKIFLARSPHFSPSTPSSPSIMQDCNHQNDFTNQMDLDEQLIGPTFPTGAVGPG